MHNTILEGNEKMAVVYKVIWVQEIKYLKNLKTLNYHSDVPEGYYYIVNF
jgi:hypothetical protein